MPKKEPQRSRKRVPEMTPEREKLVDELLEVLRRKRQEEGSSGSFERVSDDVFDILRDVHWKDEEERLKNAVTKAERVNVDGKSFQRLSQSSSATYFGRFGAHRIEEALYREVGVHNGRTVKPIELVVGIVENMTPDMARIVGEMSAECGSRALVRVLASSGHTPPSRAFLADQTTAMGSAIADTVAELESESRSLETVPDGIASLSCGLDRMSIRMSELADEGTPPPRRSEPYERAVPPPKEYSYRKAWVGSTTAYDVDGNALHTWRFAVEADADPNALADRVAADVAWLRKSSPEAPLHCVQDAAPELRALPEALLRAMPTSPTTTVIVDFEHLAGYLDAVVDACDPPGDPRDMKGEYRHRLLADDGAIDRVERGLKRWAKRLPARNTKGHDAIDDALRYIKPRKEQMRYASFHQRNLPIGSGATESTCWQMQQRTKLPGQSWEPTGLRGVLAIRALVLSDRWATAWPTYAAQHRADVHVVA